MSHSGATMCLGRARSAPHTASLSPLSPGIRGSQRPLGPCPPPPHPRRPYASQGLGTALSGSVSHQRCTCHWALDPVTRPPLQAADGRLRSLAARRPLLSTWGFLQKVTSTQHAGPILKINQTPGQSRDKGCPSQCPSVLDTPAPPFQRSLCPPRAPSGPALSPQCPGPSQPSPQGMG